jgi:hypothetical protein
MFRRLFAKIGNVTSADTLYVKASHLIEKGTRVGQTPNPRAGLGQRDAQVGIETVNMSMLTSLGVPKKRKEVLGLRRDYDPRMPVERLLHQRGPGSGTTYYEEVLHDLSCYASLWFVEFRAASERSK